jgi:membrane associated rhomboid family serine protease
MAPYSNRYSLFGGTTPWVVRLIVANLVVFGVGILIGPEVIIRWLSFRPAEVLTRPWGVATYMFVHGGFLHLFFNLLVLFFFGPPLESKWGSNEFLKFYVLCGLGGAVLSLFFSDAAIIGASAAVYGVMLAFAMNWPDAPILIWGILPVKAKWMVAGLTVLAVLSAAGGAQQGIAHFAHLGGLIVAYLYLKLDWRTPRLDGFRHRSGPRRLTLVPREDRAEVHGTRSPRKRPPPAVREEVLLDRVDQVLDKISAQGIDALTAEERAILDEVSRRHRTN